MATAATLSMPKRTNTLSKKKKFKRSKKRRHPTPKDEFTKLIKEISCMPTESNKFYACAALPKYWNDGGTNSVGVETEALLKFFQKYFGDDIDDIYIPNWIRIGMFTTNSRQIADQFVSLCNKNKIIQCYGRNIRAYSTKYNKNTRKYLVHILNINWCINDSVFNEWIHSSFHSHNEKNKTRLEMMNISNIKSFCSPLNPSEIDKKVIIELNNEITRDWLLKNEDIKFKNWPFYFYQWSKNMKKSDMDKRNDSSSKIAKGIQNNIQNMQNCVPLIPSTVQTNYAHALNWSADDVERILLNTKLAEQEQLIINLMVQNQLLNDQYLKQQQLLTALQTSNHSVIFDEFVQQKNVNIRLNIKYNELFAKYANLKNLNANNYNPTTETVVQEINQKNINSFDEMKVDKCKDMNEEEVQEWSVEDVICWILKIENGRYLKHKHAIIPNIINQQIDGCSLMKLKLIDISRIGITAYWDQEWLMHHIKTLVGKQKLKPQTMIKS